MVFAEFESPFVKLSDADDAVNRYALSSSNLPSIITDVPQWNSDGTYVGNTSDVFSIS